MRKQSVGQTDEMTLGGIGMDKSFDWERLGDIQLGRKNLGEMMPIAIYRLMQYTIKDELEARFGKEEAESIIREAGFRAGLAFAQNTLPMDVGFAQYVSAIQTKMREMKIGILRLEKSDLKNLSFVMTVSEDLDCSGLPVTGDTVCVYDEGFIDGLLYRQTGKRFAVHEIDCWAAGDRTCRFTAQVIE
jgi:predicted hydrocarbon binding protein